MTVFYELTGVQVIVCAVMLFMVGFVLAMRVKWVIKGSIDRYVEKRLVEMDEQSVKVLQDTQARCDQYVRESQAKLIKAYEQHNMGVALDSMQSVGGRPAN